MRRFASVVALAPLACILIGCSMPEATQPQPQTEARKVSTSETKQPQPQPQPQTETRKVQYSMYVTPTQTGCTAQLEQTLDGEPFRITAHLGCKECRDPNINSCRTTSKSCLVVSVECPTDSHTTADFNPDGPVRCFPEAPSRSVPMELGEAVRHLCIPKELHEPSGTAFTMIRSTASAKNDRLLANKKHTSINLAQP
mmetsp:Transcript_118861/g.236822  ORF Transcript_118861/g.236822 Transcript_118861/m.236822 type:complete len:198 (-) Transcript_118861:78-671(-)